MQNSILLVEDEEALGMILGDRLRSEGYVVEHTTDGDDGFERAVRVPFDLIILDILLPGRDGLTLCHDIRQFGLGTPILMLTALEQTADKVAGLKTGADDYVTKPFNMQELMARVEALLRRAPIKPTTRVDVCQFGTVRVDLRGTEVTRDGNPVSLSAREFQLLRFFIEHAGDTLSREDLLREVWEFDAKRYTRTVDVHVASLRQKLEADPKRSRHILTVQGTGYRFKP